MDGRIGIIAGEGRLPVDVAERLAGQGSPAVVYALRGDVSPFEGIASDIVALQKPNLGFALRSMREHGIDRLIMAGRVPKSLALKPSLFDLEGQRFLASLLFRDDHSLLGAIVDFFEKKGFRVAGYKDIVPELLAKAGRIAGRAPTGAEEKDARYAFDICSRLVPLSFGQAVVVNKGAVIAVEAIEGTDSMILRAGELSDGGVVAKMMRLDQDERYDIPAAGPQTLENMARAGLTCLALHAGRALTLEPERFAELAEKHGIAVIGVEL